MKVSVTIETGESRYETYFEVADLDAASERLAATLADIEKRFVKRKAREASTRPRTATPSTPSTPGGAK